MHSTASALQPQTYGQYGAGGVAQGSWPSTAHRSQPSYEQQRGGGAGYYNERERDSMNYPIGTYPNRSAARPMNTGRDPSGRMAMMPENDSSSSYSQRRNIHDRDSGWPTNRGSSGTAEYKSRPPPPGYGNYRQQQGNMMPPSGATSIGAIAGNQEWSNDIIDHKRYILFVVPDNQVCQKALIMVANLNEVLVRNYNSIPATKRPSWLTGVPTLYSVVDNKPYQGALCMNILEQLSAWEFKGPNDLDMSTQMKLHSHTENQDPESYVSAGNRLVGVYVPNADDERKYISGKLDEGDFEKYKELREKTGIYRPTGMGTPTGGIDQLIK